jgi:hypothetical protein
MYTVFNTTIIAESMSEFTSTCHILIASEDAAGDLNSCRTSNGLQNITVKEEMRFIRQSSSSHALSFD